jgi:hypothetical protein
MMTQAAHCRAGSLQAAAAAEAGAAVSDCNIDTACEH